MSRIYEALQKAETERTTETTERDIPSTQEDAREVMSAPAEIPVFARSADIGEFSTGSGTMLAEVEAAPTTSFHDLDLSSIPRHPWAPNVTKLPALLDRGTEVEQFRSLRSRIYELRDTSPLKSILISSGLPQEGKSFIAVNLAVSLARHKSSRVLLIDGDMRRYTLHQILGCEPHPGLAEYLAGRAGILEVMQRSEETPSTTGAEHHALPPNLTFIAGGDGGDKAADLSGNSRFGELIRAVSSSFDWIVVDSSPVLPVSDAVNLARACDGVLLVARSGITKFPVAQRAQAELKASRILGFVLNAVPQPPHSAGYYGYNTETE